MSVRTILRNKFVIGSALGAVLLVISGAALFGFRATAATYIRVADQSKNGALRGAAPGADLRGLVLQQGDRAPIFASAVAAAAIMPGSEETGDRNGYQDAAVVLGNPADDDAFVSLGGGGEIILQLPVRAQAGDQLTVHEFGAPSAPSPDHYRVFVGSAPDGPWQELGEGSGTASFTLPDAL
jgi:hypothetical protein